MSKPKPIYESPWMAVIADEKGDKWFVNPALNLRLCASRVRRHWYLGRCSRIKMTVSTTPTTDAVKIADSGVISTVKNNGNTVLAAGILTTDDRNVWFTPRVSTIVRSLLNRYGTLYTKCYIEA